MTRKSFNVAVLGAAGGIGQPLSLLLKNSPLVSKLVLFDVVDVVKGVAADLSHIETPAKVVAVAGSIKDQAVQEQRLAEALQTTNGESIDLVVIPAGVPRKPGMTRDDLFKINAGIVQKLVEAVGDHCPGAMLCVISNPVNSLVPIAAEVLRKSGVYNPQRLFGVSTLDIVRANTFLAEHFKVSPAHVRVPVVGGHSGKTILPLFSQSLTTPATESGDTVAQTVEDTARLSQLSADTVEALTLRVQGAGTEVVEAKGGAGSATLSMAYAGARFVISTLKALSGEKGVVECAYVASALFPDVPFFASKVLLGTEGIVEVLPLGDLTPAEKKRLDDEVFPALKNDIRKGIDFAQK